MNRKEMEKWLYSIGAVYEVEEINGVEFIYVFGKDAYFRKKEHPRKYKDEFVPYLRISWHDGNRIYTRHNGLTGYLNLDDVKNICRDLTEKES